MRRHAPTAEAVSASATGSGRHPRVANHCSKPARHASGEPVPENAQRSPPSTDTIRITHRPPGIFGLEAAWFEAARLEVAVAVRSSTCGRHVNHVHRPFGAELRPSASGDLRAPAFSGSVYHASGKITAHAKTRRRFESPFASGVLSPSPDEAAGGGAFARIGVPTTATNGTGRRRSNTVNAPAGVTRSWRAVAVSSCVSNRSSAGPGGRSHVSRCVTARSADRSQTATTFASTSSKVPVALPWPTANGKSLNQSSATPELSPSFVDASVLSSGASSVATCVSALP